MKNKNTAPRKEHTHTKILIICEGSEEEEFIVKLNSLKKWKETFDVSVYNAEGNGNLYSKYEYWRGIKIYNAIVILCDTENPPFKQFEILKGMIEAYISRNKKSTRWDEIIFYGNPATMQIVLSNFDDHTLDTNNKSANSKLINSFSGNKEEYEARKKQRHSLLGKITEDTYSQMKKNLRKVSQGKNYTLNGATNILNLFDGLEGNVPSWPNSIIF
ncbi:MAG: hypothetical protein LUD29_03700 [Clostridia bacterium]|nr:hypothetical protein [Clostridia bacterium]